MGFPNKSWLYIRGVCANEANLKWLLSPLVCMELQDSLRAMEYCTRLPYVETAADRLA